MNRADVRDEIIRCGRDPVYFINRYVKIRHPVRGLIPFHTFPYQDNALRSFIGPRFNIVLKPRQTGYTEIVAAFVAWLLLFHREQSIMVISTKSETAKNVVKRVKTAIKNVPKWLLLSDVISDNKLSVEMGNGSWVKSVSRSQDAGRSEALSLLIIDEAAHVENLDEIWTGLKPTVSAGGRIIMLSTPNGVGNTFHKLYAEALAGTNGFNAIRTDWWEHPEHISDLETGPDGAYTSSWFRKEIKGLSDRQISQEYLCEFLSSGDTFFSAEVMALVNGDVMQSLFVDNNFLGGEPVDGLEVYALPSSGTRYIIGADTATGDGHDNSALHVFDVDLMQQVAEYNGKLKPDKFGDLAFAIGMKYNKALMVPENNAVGIAFIQQLRHLQYPNLFYSRKGVVGEGQQCPTAYPPSNQYVAGVTTLGNNRSLMLNKLESLLREQKVRFHSQRFQFEMQTFVWHNGRAEARSGKCDDLVMAAAFLIWAREILYGNQYNTAEFYKALIGSTHIGRRLNTDIHGASKNPDLVPSRTMGAFGMNAPRNPYIIRMPNGRSINMADIVGLGAYVPKRG